KTPPAPNRTGVRRAAPELGGVWATRVGGVTAKKVAPVEVAVGGGAEGRPIGENRQQANGNRQVERVCERR
ncbi:hypothetical protein P1997_17995, partial [Xanthomonas perforans]